MTLTPSNWDQGFHEGMASMIPGTEERDATIRSIRDWADTLASAIAEYLDIEIGDDNRWEQARIAFEKFAETDERDATIAALKTKIEELEKGLQPFAKAYGSMITPHMYKDGQTLEHFHVRKDLTVGHLRRASEVLKGTSFPPAPVADEGL